MAQQAQLAQLARCDFQVQALRVRSTNATTALRRILPFGAPALVAVDAPQVGKDVPCLIKGKGWRMEMNGT